MVFSNLSQGPMKVDVIHGSQNKLRFKFQGKHVFNKSNLEFRIFLFEGFLNNYILNVFVLFHFLY